MQAVDVAVRAPSGDVQFNTVPITGQSYAIQARPGEAISLNVSEQSLRGYARAESDLIVELANGQTVVIQDYFTADGARLFISAGGTLSEVTLTDAGDGILLANYGPAETFGKWSPNDEMIFLDDLTVVADVMMVEDEETSMLATSLLGTTLAGGTGLGAAAGAAVVGAAVLGGGDDGDGSGGGGTPVDPGTPPTITPEIDGAGENVTIYGDDPQEITVTGIAEPGAVVVVTIGDQQIETVAAEDASWSAVFTGDQFPEDGNYTVTAVVTDPDGRVTDLSGPIFDIDVTAPPVEVDTGTESTGTLVNAEMQAGGVTLSGSVEPGAEVLVEIDGMIHEAVVTDGTWSLTLDGTAVGTGTYTQPVTITATDMAGNATVLTDTIVVDTEISLTADTAAMGGDGTINAVERADGVTLTGTSEPGASVVVTMAEFSQTVTVDADGNWSVAIAAADLPEGETSLDVTATATDLAGNVATTTDTIAIDTLVTNFTNTSTPGGADGVVNASEAAQGVTLTGTTEPGSTVSVSLGGVTQPATVAADGTWSVTYPASDLPQGETSLEMSATATDAAGNTETLSDTIAIDTQVTNFTNTSTPGGADGVVNASEAAQGVTLTGTTEPGSTVSVSLGGVTQPATVAADGTWSVTYPASDLPQGETTLEMSATATDAAGNTETLSDTIAIDTQVTNFTNTSTPGGADGVVNASEAAQGVTLTGTTEPGSTVSVSLGGVTQPATVAADGTWSVTYPASDLPQGETSLEMSATATDAAGNTETLSDTIAIDTQVTNFTNTSTPGGADGVVNASEAAQGVTLTGTTEPGSTVSVSLGGVTQPATVAADGTWTVTYPASDLPQGETTLEMSATATDAAGNTETLSDTIAIDTQVTNFTNTSTPGGADGVVNGSEAAQGVTLTGTTEPGSTVSVSLGGVTQPATVAADGTWTVTYPASDLPQGETSLEMSATATDTAGNTETLSDTIAFDTLVTNFADTSQIGGTDGVINGAEAANGVTLTGTSEPGSAVEVSMGGQTETTTAAPDGSWSVTYPAAALPQGETTLPVTVTATDKAGNVATTTGAVEVDTLVTDFAITAKPGGADGIINAEEATQGLALTGTTEPGSSVVVSFAGATVPATVAPDGSWTATFPASAIPAGEGTYEIAATATDAAGNTQTLTQPVVVDTDAGRLTISAAPVEGDDVVNAVEASDGVTLTGTSEPNQMVTVTLGGASHDVMTNANGIWNATFAPGEIPQGTYDAEITATITDPAGNTLVRTDAVRIDTEVDNFGISTQPIAGDGIVNGIEAANGFALSGTTEPGSTVTVVVDGVPRQASVDQNGNWTVAFGSNALPSGTYNATATVSTVDPAGNTTQTTTGFLVDTEVDRLEFSGTPIAGDGVVNAAEAAAGVTIDGRVEPGSTLVVTLNGVAHDANVDAAGNWSVTIAEADLPAGELDATITLDATDAAGNTRSESQVVRFDTVASDAPEVTDYTRNHTGLTGVSLEATEDAVYIGHLDGQGGVDDVSFSAFDVPNRGETTYFFDETVPDGSHLVVTGTDAAGNTAGTFHVVDDPKTNQVGMNDALAQTLSVFEIETIDLQFAEDSQLTLTEAQITALSAASDTVTITGGVDDTVTITGAQAVGQTTQDGQTFNVFALGDATVQIEDDITNVVI